MGRVRVDLVKRSARRIIEKYFSRLTIDFDTNKKICDEVAKIPSKRLRNKISGYITHLMKRIERAPVRGISLKLQEEERERRMDFIPERSVLDKDVIEVDEETLLMLQAIDFPNIHGVTKIQPAEQQYQNKSAGAGNRGGDRKAPREPRAPRQRREPEAVAPQAE